MPCRPRTGLRRDLNRMPSSRHMLLLLLLVNVPGAWVLWLGARGLVEGMSALLAALARVIMHVPTHHHLSVLRPYLLCLTTTCTPHTAQPWLHEQQEQ